MLQIHIYYLDGRYGCGITLEQTFVYVAECGAVVAEGAEFKAEHLYACKEYSALYH
jgi:hypothetical protein